jgi:hypothetical protein
VCKRSKAFLSGIQIDTNNVQLFEKYRLPCKSFSCPECAPKKTKVVKSRIFNGRINDPAIRKNKFSAKFFTFTCGGKEFRERYTPAQALDMMQAAFNKQMTGVRRHYGKVDYFRVTEPHKDGYPHFHVLFISPTITGKGFYRHVENMWRVNYGMGFIKAKVVNNVEHGVNYMCKYLTKSLRSIKKYQRIFSSSRGSLAPMKKKESNWLDFRSVMFQYAGISDPGKIYSLSLEKIESLGIIECLGKSKNYEDLQEFIAIIKEGGELLPITNND